jgi:hypothetical protein
VGDLGFGPDGNLYVTVCIDYTTSCAGDILRFDGNTGAALGSFVRAGDPRPSYPYFLVFGPDGNLYVTDHDTNRVLRYDGTTGASMGVFASAGGLDAPTGLAFFDPGIGAADPDGDGIANSRDNCPLIANPDQVDADGDGLGDACDPCPTGGTDTDRDGSCDLVDPDDDNDGVLDAADNCPLVPNPAQLDLDGDGFGDGCDNCPYHTNQDQTDTDHDGRGDACECTDQNGDGRNDVRDVVAINLAIFNPALVSPLCDGNNSHTCDVEDIKAAVEEIFSAGNTSTCARQPRPGP